MLIETLAMMLAAASPAPVAAAPAELSLEGRTLLRCSAAFALVAHGQSAGDEKALAWPQLHPRGREFFVRALAQLIDQTGLDREGVAQLARDEVAGLQERGDVDQIMPACLVMLENSGV
ncbi:MAG: hypothetical protein A3J40_01430 [Erythrobacter sp. RIFCSPHIGHO2_12_FULL_63_10]|nr:MAG: hypothetical protein A3J40_01430 [Erythrobacter sp. RIFCSPHIGHO2_12_FULL_63_10]